MTDFCPFSVYSVDHDFCSDQISCYLCPVRAAADPADDPEVSAL